MTWFRKEKQKLRAADRRDLPTDVFDKCPECGEILYRARLEQNVNVCPTCGHHRRIAADDYIRLLADEGSFEETEAELRSADPLGFVDLKPYTQRLEAAERATGRGDAVVTGLAELEGIPVALAVMDFEFIGGSMGSVVGEKIARVARRALDERRPLIIVSASGGARMMEGILSLMQMAKTSVALAELHEAGIPYISVLTNPTTGGVTASYGMLGDVNLAEPGALIGFAGPRVIEQTIKQELPSGFQRSEFLLEHGMVDHIVDRRMMKATLARLLRHMLGLPVPAAAAEGGAAEPAAAAAAAEPKPTTPRARRRRNGRPSREERSAD
ncbi:MAG: acetyl-CoA carboxylase carboxyltransferase subunit beta [Gemmatimonadetes bacterium]|nr:acetyl-CoA carboxylase carboxyltransferase subunit beta [Gemmatimonadota bacterium]